MASVSVLVSATYVSVSVLVSEVPASTTTLERVQHTAGHGSGPASIDEIDGMAYCIWVWSMANLLREICLATGTGRLEDIPAVFRENGWCPPQNCGIQFNLGMEAMLRDVAKVIGHPRPMGTFGGGKFPESCGYPALAHNAATKIRPQERGFGFLSPQSSPTRPGVHWATLPPWTATVIWLRC